jgi:hypothetical protein
MPILPKKKLIVLVVIYYLRQKNTLKCFSLRKVARMYNKMPS